MSSNKKFRIQNGVDITGEVVVGNQLVINADGTITASSVSDSISGAFGVEVASLQAQIDALLSSSPEHLDTLQEIVALFQSEDNDLSTLINQNAAAIAALQTLVDSKGDGSQMTSMSTTISQVQAILAAEETTTSGQIVYMSGAKYPFNSAGPDPHGSDGNIYCFDAQTGNLLSTIEHPYPFADWSKIKWGESISENDQYIAIGHTDIPDGPNLIGRVFVYQKDSNGLPSGNPTILNSPSPVSNGSSQSYFGKDVEFVGDYLFVGEHHYHNTGGEGRVCVFQISTGFQFVRSFNMSDGTGDTSGGHYGLGVVIVGSGDYAIFGIPHHEEMPYPSQGINTGQIWIVDTNNINAGHITLNPPQQINSSGYGARIAANDTHFMVVYDTSTLLIYETSTRNIIHTSTSDDFSTAPYSNIDYDMELTDSYAMFGSEHSVEVYTFPSMVKLESIINPSANSLNKMSAHGSEVTVTSTDARAAYIFDIESSFTVPVTVIDDPDPTNDQFGYTVRLSSVGGVATTAVPTLSTTSTNVIGAINDLHSGISSLSGGSHITYDASTGDISIDETDAAANLHVASSGDANTLEGHSGDYYRLDVYDANDTIIN